MEVIESDRDEILKMIEAQVVDIGLIGKAENEQFGSTL